MITAQHDFDTIKLTKVTTDIRAHQWNTEHLKVQHFRNAIMHIIITSMIVACGNNVLPWLY